MEAAAAPLNPRVTIRRSIESCNTHQSAEKALEIDA